MSDAFLNQAFTEEAQAILDEIERELGMVPNFYKAQAAVNAQWLKLNWTRYKTIVLAESALDRKTKELIAMTVSLVSRCEYCSLAHEAIARSVGASDAEINETLQVIELFSSFNAIADSLRLPCDITPDSLQDES